MSGDADTSVCFASENVSGDTGETLAETLESDPCLRISLVFDLTKGNACPDQPVGCVATSRHERMVTMSALKGIPMSISPELLEVLARMGHGDHIVLADGNFPGESQGADYVIRVDGMGVPALLKDLLKLMPVDTGESSAYVMAVPKGQPEPPIWAKYREIINKAEKRDVKLVELDRFAFYDFTKEKAFAIVMTGETALYANLILVKGVVAPKK